MIFTIHTNAKAEVGSKKKVRKFAFIPLLVNEQIVWFKWYEQTYEYVEVKDDYYECLKVTIGYEWVPTERRLL